ncbi:hypothetical protein [Erythrobacter neustonensis]|uniref:Uncharacterized protein n=1 Tax=Erythrobacter neustonensis TaxID=1112 RepID=A0A192D1P1_9SPHN|nr:hypothetical protein [Erythrobacter neustonensis]ANK12418.1 hypothetical protein A9D12_05035 [Erythrobacter neustonensis]
MSVHFDVNKISFFGLDDWSVAVCAWRGCCLEVFARAEQSVANCLEALEKAGVTLGKDARDPFAGTRLKALSACIAAHDFGGHGKVAQMRIGRWEQVHELRAYLAHGTVKASGSGAVIQLVAFDGKTGKRQPPRQLSRVEMLTVLAELEQVQIQLHHQLGQIKALAAQAKPLKSGKTPAANAAGGGDQPR